MSPLNAANRQSPADDSNLDAQVLMTQQPDPRAVEEGWNTEYVRSPDGTTGNMETVGVQDASLKRFTDDTVPSTTGTFQFNARHVKPGSTAGAWVGWVKGSPRSNPTSTGEEFPGLEPSLNNFLLKTVTDDSTNLEFVTQWSPNARVNDDAHTLELDLFKSTAQTQFITSITASTAPASVTSSTDVVSNTTYADGTASQRHVAEGRLTDGTNTIDSKSNPTQDTIGTF